ncbi:hypothetical protein [Ottowia sp.]|uniref:hypothetical protein n=1 Tax=Ottowia sp. TaxID=1898956 RepID=UPI00262E2F26|nr:hypothetical protein [Ottowia sp.]
MKLQLLMGALALGLLGGCSEKPQNLVEGGGSRSSPAYQGTGVAAFTAPGWKAGDETSWAHELRARGQWGQNEFTRITPR